MMKNALRRMAALFCAAVLAACAPASPASTPERERVSFADDLGREISVLCRPKRTAALIGSFADVWLLAGGELAAAANDAWTEFGLSPDGGVVNLGKTTEISLERLLAADPDFILASVNTQIDLELRETFEAAGIPTAYFDVNVFDEYLRMLEICTRITGRADLYETNGLEVQRQVGEALARGMPPGEGPEVLYLRATAKSVKAKGSEGNVLGEMLRDLGCVNIADSDQTLLDSLSLETIIERDPEMIFVVKQGNNSAAVDENLDELVFGNKAWSTLTAVREGRVYEMEPRLYNLKPNNRWGEAYEMLCDILYGNR